MKTIVTTAATLAVGLTLLLNTGSVHAEEVAPVDTQLDFDAVKQPQSFTFGQLAANVVGGAAGGAVGGALTASLVGTPIGAAAGGAVGALGGAVAGLVGNALTQLVGVAPIEDAQFLEYDPSAAFDSP